MISPRHAKNLLKLRQKAETEAADLPALMVAAEKAVASVLQGQHNQRKSGTGERFWQFREYTPQDRPQDIDWRQSGKTERIYIRQREWQTTQTALFWCAFYAGMDFRSSRQYSEKGDVARTLALGLAILMTRAGEQVGMLGAARRGRSDAALERMGNMLCNPLAPEELASAGDALPKQASLIQIGDFLQPIEKIHKSFQALSARTSSGYVVQVLDPAEIALPYSGRVIFEGAAVEKREQVNHVTSIRDAYQERIQEHTRRIGELCRQYRWGYVLHRTDQSLTDTLSTVWEDMTHNMPSQGRRLS